MKFQVRVKTHCEKQEIHDFGDHKYLVHLTCVPEHNKANTELINLMSKHLGVPPLRLKIISGLTSRDKILETIY
jgi:uncharacterized protein YggU (UPF0235/DUF167 family)